MGTNDHVARQAVEAVRSALVADLRFYPREPTAPDHGIDLYVECATDDVPNGRMIGIQVKGGASFFREVVEDGTAVVFRGKSRHMDYWQRHSLPVIVVLYDPARRTAVWQCVTPETVHPTGSGFKLVIPLDRRLDGSSVPALLELAEDDAYTVRLNALRSDLSWMRLLRDGGDVLLKADEWINKSSGRGTVRLHGRTTEGEEFVSERAVFFGFEPYADALPGLVPWARLAVDDDFYASRDEELYLLDEGVFDKEEGRYIVVGADFEEWREQRDLEGLRPYEVTGETAHWRLQLTLGELGRSLLVLDEFLRAY